MASARPVVRTLICAALFSALPAISQQPPDMTNVGPMPPALAAAKTVFVSNAGSDSGLFPEPFTGDPNRTYSEFYSKLKATGAFQLVDDPSQADVVAEIQLTAPTGPTRANKQLGASDPMPMFRLVIYDRKTHCILWTETDSIEGAYLQKTHDHNFDQALDSVLNLFLQDCGKPLSSPPPQK